MEGWHDFIAVEREKELADIIRSENLKEAETRRYVENAFRDGEIKTTGTDIDSIMPPVSRFGGGNRAKKKQGIIDKLRRFFERFFGISGSMESHQEDGDGMYVVKETVEPIRVAETKMELG